MYGLDDGGAVWRWDVDGGEAELVVEPGQSTTIVAAEDAPVRAAIARGRVRVFDIRRADPLRCSP